MLFRFCLYGFLKNQRYFEPFLMLILISLGFSFFQIGVLIAIREITVNLLEIPSGAIADVTGRRGSMMVSFVAYIVSFLVFAQTANFWMFAVAMVLYGIGDSFRTGTHKAMIFEWLRLQGRTDEKTKIYGITRSWSKIGSAASGVIAASFVFLTGDYRLVFWFAMAPYAANLINFLGYPASLDGQHQKSFSLRQVFQRMYKTFFAVFRSSRLRLLMTETICWGGYLAAVKDYLQPVLKLAAVAWFAALLGEPLMEEASNSLTGSEDQWLTDQRKVAIAVGTVYSLVNLVSAWASRSAARFQEFFGGARGASSRLWQYQGALFLVLAVFAFLKFSLGMIVVFVAVDFFAKYLASNTHQPLRRLVFG